MSKQIYTEFLRCIQCHGCEVACQREHGSISNVNVVTVEDRFAVPIACHHCNPAPCALSCPHDALKSDGSQVKFDPEKCTGCRLCQLACPFGAMGFDLKTLKVSKCDFCEERQKNGKKPACVVTCPSRAMEYNIYKKHSTLKRRRFISSIAGGMPLKGGLI